MKIFRGILIFFLFAIVIISMFAGFVAPNDYAAQFREHPNASPSRAFPLGTDDLGRDRFSRLLAGSRVSLLCAPAAALVAMAFAAFIGIVAGFQGGWIDEIATSSIDLFLSLPWLFALLTARAMLPLNATPWTATATTFLLLATVGWASGARVVRAAVVEMRSGGPILHARAAGCHGARLLIYHVLPNLRPVLAAQFWVLVPVFLLSEANLGLLGLGVAEPMPSLGNMLAELQNYQRIPETPWILAPAVLLTILVSGLHFLVSGRNVWE
jgi:peptide/nickel transport system permease protein